jgi:hypothetical protein
MTGDLHGGHRRRKTDQQNEEKIGKGKKTSSEKCYSQANKRPEKETRTGDGGAGGWYKRRTKDNDKKLVGREAGLCHSTIGCGVYNLYPSQI